MTPSKHVTVRIDLSVVRGNAQAIRDRVGVPVIAVVKSDAYGVGAGMVTAAIADVVERFCFFSLAEAAAVAPWQNFKKESMTIGPPGAIDADEYVQYHVKPAVAAFDQAMALERAEPIVCVDTGQQRFACPPDEARKIFEQCDGCDEAFTHAANLDQVEQLKTVFSSTKRPAPKLHAAGSSLLDVPAARLDAVRPGMALYQGSTRVSTRLAEVRDSGRAAGYSGFVVPRLGVILCGYSNGIRTGPCLINGRPAQILEVGMQSAFVECASQDRVGDEVVLLGEGLTEQEVARGWDASPQWALLQLAGTGAKEYLPC